MKIYKLILMRHGESKWNKLNKFTGWKDIDLSETGISEAKECAKLLKSKEFNFNYAYTSVLKRSIHTMWTIIKHLNQSWIPIKKSWHLNERHYGSLQGLNKDDVIKEYGNEQVQKWRRGFDVALPQITLSEKKTLALDPKYSHINIDDIPLSESLKNTSERVIPFWKTHIYPNLKAKKNIIIVAHGNSLRALIKHLSNMNDADIMKLDIATGIPMVYEFNNYFEPIKYYYL
ncbi:phosphoglyceromutase [Buchnera aphidicola (Schlechtendalia chinensis)]|uniref:2,3-bisphosphoglycerate-dependent phosphoglycerate mutase n=1 Tax=Buchnera aphidicola subsp. Schlechtendalia chinensis TaxID=118110 RepID=A0A172WDP6_BUCSC|nr:2,3-diphosphoglycerate-dependent phosphoglycerate mutase [Buchnera aphidicola]ANF17062.1 phosphoglyceromutase [Buchnera aphidicola (Schlechtendalia chinensis)]